MCYLMLFTFVFQFLYDLWLRATGKQVEVPQEEQEEEEVPVVRRPRPKAE